MKKLIYSMLSVLLITAICLLNSSCGISLLALAGIAASSDEEINSNANVGNYYVEILSARAGKTYDNKPAAIVKFKFTNYSEDNKSFALAVSTTAFQNDVELDKPIRMSDSSHYSSDKNYKDVRSGGTVEVEVAYELNDTKHDLVVEVTEFFSLDNKKITKTFKMGE